MTPPVTSRKPKASTRMLFFSPLYIYRSDIESIYSGAQHVGTRVIIQDLSKDCVNRLTSTAQYRGRRDLPTFLLPCAYSSWNLVST